MSRKPVQVDEDVKGQIEGIKNYYGLRTESDAIKLLALHYNTSDKFSRDVLEHLAHMRKGN